MIPLLCIGIGLLIGFRLQSPPLEPEIVYLLPKQECDETEAILWDIATSMRHADENFQFIDEMEDVPEHIVRLIKLSRTSLREGFGKAREIALPFGALCSAE